MRSTAHFVEPMLLLRNEQLPNDPNWLLELKLHGYRALAFKTGGQVHLRSRNDNDFNGHYPGIVQALESMPDDGLQRAAELRRHWNSAQLLRLRPVDS